MSDITQVNGSHSLAAMSERFEALVRDFGLLRQLEDLAYGSMSANEAATRFAGMIALEGLSEYCSVMLLDSAGTYLELRAVASRYASRGFAMDAEIWRGKRFALGEGIAGRVAATGVHARIDDTRADPNFIALPDSPVNIRSLMCFPLLFGDQVLGVINLSHGAPLFFNIDRENAMHVIARRMGNLLGPLLAEGGSAIAAAAGEARGEVAGHWARGDAASRLLEAHRLHTLGQLASGIVHDLNNHLTAIVGNLDLALVSDSGERARDLVARARTASLRGTEIVNSILKFGRAGTTDAAHEPLEVRHILGEAAGVMRASLNPAIALEVDGPEGSCMIRGDNGQLNQILVNLGLNARDAVEQHAAENPGARPAIRIGAENVHLDEDMPAPWRDGQSGDFVRLFVTDNGTGMTPAVQARMYEPFFTTKPAGKGTGLGLPTVYRIVRHHQGWLDVHSTPKQGTTVNIYLPTCTVEKPEPPGGAPAKATGGACILLVDDEPLVRNLGVAILRRLGYSPLEASGGHEAIAVYREHAGEIALVILDLQMPDLGGEAVLKALRELTPGLPIVYSTGKVGADLDAWPPELRPTGFLQKPYLIATLAEVIQESIGRTVGT